MLLSFASYLFVAELSVTPLTFPLVVCTTRSSEMVADAGPSRAARATATARSAPAGPGGHRELKDKDEGIGRRCRQWATVVAGPGRRLRWQGPMLLLHPDREAVSSISGFGLRRSLARAERWL